MISVKQLVCITGLMLVSFVIYTQQEALSNDEFHLGKRLIGGHARTSIPLFRGSNLGIFVRKRPSAAIPEHSVIRRKDTRSASANDESVSDDLLNYNDQQRRFDDYSENPGPMFGR